MLVILPNQSAGMPSLEAGLSANEISSIGANLTLQQVELSLPRFNITTSSIAMKPLLESLGLTDAFSPSASNFTGISNVTLNPLYISQVFHKAFISVNENGTEAAAATAVVMEAGAVLRPPQPQQVFNANHPFLFFIVDKNTGTILFMGKEANPAISS
jgi:serpin B